MNVRMCCSLLILSSSSPDPNSEHVLRILRKSHVSSVLVGASLSEPHIDEFVVEFLYISENAVAFSI